MPKFVARISTPGTRSVAIEQSRAPRRHERRKRSHDRCELSAHSETVGAGAKMPVRQQRQVSTKAVTRAGYDCSTPIPATPARWPLRTSATSVRAIASPFAGSGSAKAWVGVGVPGSRPGKLCPTLPAVNRERADALSPRPGCATATPTCVAPVSPRRVRALANPAWAPPESATSSCDASRRSRSPARCPLSPSCCPSA